MFDPYGNRVNRAGGRAGVQNRRTASAAKNAQPTDPDAFDWSASNGVIHGRREFSDTQRGRANQDGGLSEADQSRLCYFRPLLEGEVLSYEFLYEPGQVMVHPALDRLVFLCEPAGVRLHWMTEDSYSDLSGLPADNAADELQNRRGPGALPLKPGDWNQFSIGIDGGKATLVLNGQTIYERGLEPGLSRQFSFFHFKDQTAAQVRNVVLRGRWPQALSSGQKANLVSSDGAADSVEARRARRALIDESIYALEAGAVVAEARKLAPKDRYERLAAWVLAAPDRPVWRLSGELSASFPAPACVTEAAGGNSSVANGAATSPVGAAGSRAAERSRRRRLILSPRRRRAASSTSSTRGFAAPNRREVRNHRNSSAGGSPLTGLIQIARG